jgi:hypothetical protein
VVPSWPLLSIRTARASLAPVVTPRMPAMKVAVWVPPVRMRASSAEVPALAMWMLLFPVVTLSPALAPMAVLLTPVVL